MKALLLTLLLSPAPAQSWTTEEIDILICETKGMMAYHMLEARRKGLSKSEILAPIHDPSPMALEVVDSTFRLLDPSKVSSATFEIVVRENCLEDL